MGYTPDHMAVDNKPLRDRSQRMDVHLDGVFTNEAALVAELGEWPTRRSPRST